MASIVFLDDEQNVLNALRRVFQDEGHKPVFTTSPDEALAVISAGGVAVAITDQRMPTILGIEFLEQVKRISPETVRILLTGHAEVKVALEAINRGAVYQFLQKPWDDDEVRRIVKQAAAQYELVAENRRLSELTFTQNFELKALNGNLERKVRERTQAIEELNKKLEKSFLGSVRVMAGLTQVYSNVIGSHSRRVASLSKGLGQLVGLSEEDNVQMEVAALLHDIGKLATSAEILNKPEASLRPDERETLKRLPLLGEALVKLVPNMEKAALWVRHQCERFNGGGFPDRLRGEAIPIGSRLIAVADAYDTALNTRSAYKANTPARVLERLRTRTPADFDPAVVAALERYLQEGDRINTEAEEVEVRSQDLRPGMRLSRGVLTPSGGILVQAGTLLSEEILKKILDNTDALRSTDGYFIRRNEGEAAPPQGKDNAPAAGQPGGNA